MTLAGMMSGSIIQRYKLPTLTSWLKTESYWTIIMYNRYVHPLEELWWLEDTPFTQVWKVVVLAVSRDTMFRGRGLKGGCRRNHGTRVGSIFIMGNFSFVLSVNISNNVTQWRIIKKGNSAPIYMTLFLKLYSVYSIHYFRVLSDTVTNQKALF